MVCYPVTENLQGLHGARLAVMEELAGRIVERFMEELEDPDRAVKIIWEEFAKEEDKQ